MIREKIIENLRDAGCDETLIAEYLEAADSGNQKAAAACLANYREKLLEQFHESSSRISCLDYFVTRTEKERQ